jgi:hypothetical protein
VNKRAILGSQSIFSPKNPWRKPLCARASFHDVRCSLREQFCPHKKFSISDIPKLEDKASGWRSGQVGQHGCTVHVQSVKQINIFMVFDFDIRASLRRDEPGDFHFMLCRFVSRSYWGMHLSSSAMILFSLSEFEQIFHVDCFFEIYGTHFRDRVSKHSFSWSTRVLHWPDWSHSVCFPNSINRFICATEIMCFLWGTNWILVYYLEDIESLKG